MKEESLKRLGMNIISIAETLWPCEISFIKIRFFNKVNRTEAKPKAKIMMKGCSKDNVENNLEWKT